MNRWSKKLRLRREVASLSLEAVSEATGISRQTLASYELGRTSPTVKDLGVILEFWGERLSEFFESRVPQRYSSTRHQELHEKLQVILDEEDKTYEGGIALNVDAIYEYVLAKQQDDRKGEAQTPLKKEVG